ncbi:MAG: hypothetical protein ACE5FT_07480 [Candidatus Nanoarchaeia archaeon]
MKWTSGLGYAVVVLTHVYMLGFGLPASQVVPHSILNLVAAGLLYYGQYKA